MGHVESALRATRGDDRWELTSIDPALSAAGGRPVTFSGIAPSNWLVTTNGSPRAPSRQVTGILTRMGPGTVTIRSMVFRKCPLRTGEHSPKRWRRHWTTSRITPSRVRRRPFCPTSTLSAFLRGSRSYSTRRHDVLRRRPQVEVVEAGSLLPAGGLRDRLKRFSKSSSTR